MRIIRLAAIAVAAIFSVAATAKYTPTNWLTKIAVTQSGSHLLGNPGAEVKLTEYISYTCPHCAQFQKQSDSQLRLAYVMSGRLSVEVRHFVRDPIDLTVALLTNCGDPGRFFRNHGTFLHRQNDWMKVLDKAGPAQKQRWITGELRTRTRAIANDFGFYEIMAQQGYSRSEVDRCLADKPMADRLAAQTVEAEKLGVAGTPSFQLNGLLLAGTHDWASLYPQLQARF